MMRSPWQIGFVLFGVCVGSCAINVAPVPKAEYSTEIIGRWQGTSGDAKEEMTIDRDGTFICTLRPMGFIANTLSQNVTGTIRGTWKITGNTINLKITSAENERLKSVIALSTITAFKPDALVLKSDRGESSTFRRASAL